MTGLEVLAVGAVISLVAGVFRDQFRKTDPPVEAPREPVSKPREGQEIGVVFGTVLVEDLAVIHEQFSRYESHTLFGQNFRGLQLLEVNALAGICEGTIDGVVSIETRHDDGRILSLAGGRTELAGDHPQAWQFDRVANGPAIELLSRTWGQVDVAAVVGQVQSERAMEINSVAGRIAAMSGLQSAADLTAGILPPGATNTPETGAFPGRAGNIALLRWTGAPRPPSQVGYWPDGFQHGWGSPRMRSYSVWVERLQREPVTGDWTWEDARAAIPASARIGTGAAVMTWFDRNPIHCIRELLLDPTFGLGLSIDLIDNASFVYAAAVCVSEGLGVSFRLSASTTARAVIDQLLATVNGVLWEDGAGRIQIRLVRELSDGEIAALTVLDGSSCESVSWHEPSTDSLPTSVRVRYWSPVRRADVTIEAHNDAAIQTRGQVSWAEAYAYGVGDDATIEALVARELAYRTRPAAAVEARVLREVVGDWVRPGWAVIVDWDYAPPTVCRVISIDWGEAESEWVTLRLVEDVFVERGVPVHRDPPDVPEPVQPEPEQATIVYEQPPYWALDPDQYLPRDLGIEGTESTVYVVGQAYAQRPTAQHDSWVLAEQAYAGAAPVREQPPAAFARMITVRAAYSRAAASTVGTHTLLLDAGEHEVVVGAVLRVPVSYPELDWTGAPEEYAFGDDYEYVVVVDVAQGTGELAEVTVQRGAIDTQSAPTIIVGAALIAGWVRVGDEGYWYADMWSPSAQLGNFSAISRSPTIVLDGTVDARGLGRIGTHTLAWDDASPGWRARTSPTGTGVYVSRARRPVSPGACWAEESGGTVTVYAQQRSHLDAVMRVASARDDQTAEPPRGLWHDDELQCHVFDDALQWVGQADPYDGEKFVITSGDIAGWGGPWETMHLAVLAVRPDDAPIGSWQYAHLAVDSVGVVYDETATLVALARPQASEHIITPGVHHETATLIVRGLPVASEELIVPIYDETATLVVASVPEASEHLGYAGAYVGSSQSTATQAQTAGGFWTPSFGAIGGAANGDIAVMVIVEDTGDPITVPGWTVVLRDKTSAGSIQVFARTIASGWGGGNNTLAVPYEAGIAATLIVVRGALHSAYGLAVQASTGSQTIPTATTGAPYCPQLRLGIVGHVGVAVDSIGTITVSGWTSAQKVTVTTGGRTITQRVAYSTAQASAGGIASGTTVTTTATSSDTVALVNLVLWTQEA